MYVTVALLSLHSLSSVMVMASESGSGRGDATAPPITAAPNIDIDVSITASGTNAAGLTYRLVCSATVTGHGSTDQPIFTWLLQDPMNNQVDSGMVTTTGSMSTLTFSPLTASHAGTYTCRVTVGGVTETQTTTVIVNGTEKLNNIYLL